MDGFMECILSRVLSEEIGRQLRWADKEEKEFGTDRSDREENAKLIRKFMEENNIEFREDFFLQAR